MILMKLPLIPVLLSLMIPAVAQVVESESNNQAFISKLRDFDKTPIYRPSTVSDRLTSKVIDFVFDGIPMSRMDLEHPAITISCGIYPEWNISPNTSQDRSFTFVNRDSQNTTITLTLLQKDSFLKANDKDHIIAYCAGLVKKHSSHIEFEPWMDESFYDPGIPSSFDNYQPVCIGFSLTDSAGKKRSHRIYYLTLESCLLEVEFQSEEPDFKLTFPLFRGFVNRFSYDS